MTSPDARDLTGLLLRAGWYTLVDRLLGGLTHDLNGRATSLGGMAQLLSLDDDSRSMAPFLEAEIHRLASVVRLAALLTGEPGAPAEPIEAAALMPMLVDLHRRHPGFEHLETRLEVRNPPMVSADAALLVRVILLLLAEGGRSALARGRRVDVFAGAHDEKGLLVRVVAPGAGRTDLAAASATRVLEGVEPLVRLLPARFRRMEGADGLRLSLHLPGPVRRG